MHIIVPIKQVPETSDVQMDRTTGTMIRAGRSSVFNPLDLYALEAALCLKDQQKATITVMTMGPPSAVKVLKEALSMGADRAIHLTDRPFGGSDTYATSHILASAIKKAGPCDLIITGERATDGDTAQVGPAIAAWLDVGLVSYVSSVKELKNGKLLLERLVEEGYQEVSVHLPALITVVKEVAIPRLPTLSNKRRSLTTAIEQWGADDLDVDRKKIGLKGSPTRVVRIETPKVARTCIIHRAEGDEQVQAAVDRLIDYLEEKRLLTVGEGERHG